MSEDTHFAERSSLPPRTTFGLGDLGLEQKETDLAMSLLKRHRGDVGELIRTAASLGLHQMMVSEVEAQQARSKRTRPGL